MTISIEKLGQKNEMVFNFTEAAELDNKPNENTNETLLIGNK